jgi:hypothetical protein
VTAGPCGDIGRGTSGAGARGGSFDAAVRLAFGRAALVLRFGNALRRAFTALRLRAGAARLAFRPRLLARFAFRFFAIMTSR